MNCARYNFSPDSRWITYHKEGSNEKSAIWVYEITTGKKQQVTDGKFSDNTPVFSLDGNYIFFASDRDFNLSFSSFDFDYIYDKSTRLYALALTQKSPKIFKDKNDTEPVKPENEHNSHRLPRQRTRKAKTLQPILHRQQRKKLKQRLTSMASMTVSLHFPEKPANTG